LPRRNITPATDPMPKTQGYLY